MEAQVVAVEQGVPEIRGLEPKEKVSHRMIGPDRLAAELEGIVTTDNPPEYVAAEESFLKRFGLLPAEADLREQVLELLGSQVAGYYRPDTNEFVIVDGTGEFGAIEKITVAHEFTHALQDQ